MRFPTDSGRSAWLVVIVALAVTPATGGTDDAEPGDPLAVYLTWQRDPTTTMTVHWHTEGDERPSAVAYRRLDDERWHTADGASRPFPHSERTIHTVELTDLEPDTAYGFHFHDEATEYRFRTMPGDASAPVRFVVGGDTMHRPEMFQQTNRQAARTDPRFALFGGDLAYANGDPARVERWYDWFEAYTSEMVTPEGLLIPVLVAIGNHEVRGGYNGTVAAAPFFYSLFAMPGEPGYNVLDVGSYLSVLLLDSGHTNSVEGTQAEWLAEVLAERQDVPHVFPIYHVPAYPSHRSYDGNVSVQIREHWVPLFEEYGVRAVFENHDHTYKRTHPIRDGQVDEDRGIVYLGDGAWGVNVREPDPDRWYLAETASVRHLIEVTIHGPNQRFRVIDSDGNVIDEGETVVREAPAAVETGP